MGGQIIITVNDAGKAQMQSTFDPNATIVLLQKLALQLLSQPTAPPQPGIVPASVIPNLRNGLPQR